jgi:hypothetical protein
MNSKELRQLFQGYLDAYGDDPPDERARLLKQSVTEDIVFTGPAESGQGIDNLLEHIGHFQQQLPGAYLRINRLSTQHGQLLAEWTLYKSGGAAIGSGHTYARFNNQSRLTHLAGFSFGVEPA